jgi:hypothetical protein
VRSAEMSGYRAGAVKRLTARRARLVARLEAEVRALEALPACLMEGEIEADLAPHDAAAEEVFRAVVADLESIRPEPVDMLPQAALRTA